MTSVGNRERRILLSMQLSLGPLTHGIITSVLAVFMLSTSPFEFVIRHFFWLLLVVLCVGAFNSVVVFPIILSIFGPEAELVPLEHTNRISTPSPILSRNNKRSTKSMSMHGVNPNSGSSRCMNRSSAPSFQKIYHYHPKDININNPSLTTITEEPPSWKSSSSSIQMNNDWSAQSSQQQQHHQQQQQHHHHHLINGPNSHNNLSYPLGNCGCHHHGCSQPPQHTCGMSVNGGQNNLCSGVLSTPTYRPAHLQIGALNNSSTTTTNNTNSSNTATATRTTPLPEDGKPSQQEEGKLNSYPAELQSIVVQPEVTVETHHSDANMTKVTATANIKVELVTPGRAVRSYNFNS